jgi:S1-C subfamily serine protease
MTSEPGEQPIPEPNENQNPAGIPGQPAQGPHGGYWPPQGPPGPPPYWYGQHGYGEPGGGWAYGPPPTSWPGLAGYPGPGGTGTGTRRRGRLGLLIAGGAAAVLVAGTVGGFIGDAIGSSGTTAAITFTPAGGTVRPGFGSGPGSGFGGAPSSGSGQPSFGGSAPSGSAGNTGPADASAIASRVDPGLVDVNITVDYGTAKAAGTGMVINSDGVVLTNNHVIDGATSIKVTDIGNGKTYTAHVAGYDKGKDVAILKLSGASNLRTVTFASAAAAKGQEVVGIGNAGGKGGTPSYAGGTVTATGQSITASDDLSGTNERLSGMIETNANIQAGDSGGPLVNTSGQVVGMDTAGSQVSGFTTQQATTAFAIPISTATQVGRQILDSQASAGVHVGPTAFLGVEIGQSSPSGPGNGYSPGSGSGAGNTPASGSGVQIAGVVHGSPAAQAGLAAGDVITSVDGHTVTSQPALQRVMTTDVTPGQSVSVSYTTSSGQQHSATVTLASGPPA